jgi:hypothetical protein
LAKQKASKAPGKAREAIGGVKKWGLKMTICLDKNPDFIVQNGQGFEFAEAMP